MMRTVYTISRDLARELRRLIENNRQRLTRLETTLKRESRPVQREGMIVGRNPEPIPAATFGQPDSFGEVCIMPGEGEITLHRLDASQGDNRFCPLHESRCLRKVYNWGCNEIAANSTIAAEPVFNSPGHFKIIEANACGSQCEHGWPPGSVVCGTVSGVSGMTVTVDAPTPPGMDGPETIRYSVRAKGGGVPSVGTEIVFMTTHDCQLVTTCCSSECTLNELFICPVDGIAFSDIESSDGSHTFTATRDGTSDPETVTVELSCAAEECIDVTIPFVDGEQVVKVGNVQSCCICGCMLQTSATNVRFNGPISGSVDSTSFSSSSTAFGNGANFGNNFITDFQVDIDGLSRELSDCDVNLDAVFNYTINSAIATDSNGQALTGFEIELVELFAEFPIAGGTTLIGSSVINSVPSLISIPFTVDANIGQSTQLNIHVHWRDTQNNQAFLDREIRVLIEYLDCI